LRILVVSDTHGDICNLQFVAEKMGDKLDLIIHLGDGALDLDKLMPGSLGSVPRVLVRGNMDTDPSLPSDRIASANKHTIYAVHGHSALSAGSLLPLLYAAREAKASVCLFGHTHIPHRKEIEGILLINPGSLSRPRGGWGPTFVILSVPEDEKSRIEAVHYEILDPKGHPSLHTVYP
jgi:uncharacterized protein